MKKITSIIIAAALLALSTTGADARNKDSEEAAKVKEAVATLTFHIDINTILPAGGSSIMDAGYYFLEFKDGHVKSYLPFIGESYGGVMPGDDSSLSFDEIPEVSVDSSKAEKKGEYTLKFSAKAPSAKWDVILTLFENGGASINCSCSTKSRMTYWGDIDFDAKQK